MTKQLFIISAILLALFAVTSNSYEWPTTTPRASSSFDSDTVGILKELASISGFTWSSSTPKCGDYGKYPTGAQIRSSSISCRSTNTLTGLVIESAAPPGQCSNSARFSQIDYSELKSLESLYLMGNDCRYTFAQNQNFDTDGKMSELVIESVAGYLPMMPPRTVTNVTYIHGLRDSTIPLNYRIHTEIFTSKLAYFELITRAATTPMTFSPATYLSRTPLLSRFSLQASGITIPFNELYNVPAPLVTLRLFNITLTNTTFPAYGEVQWNGINRLYLQGLGFTGEVDPYFFSMAKLLQISFANNPKLRIPITDSFASLNNAKRVNLRNTNASGPLPESRSLVAGGLNFFDIRDCPGFAGTSLPLYFFCMPSSNLVEDGSDPSYLFDNNVFTNYHGPDTPRSCTSSIDSVSPYPIPSNASHFYMEGLNLGNNFFLSMSNTAGDTSSVSCVSHNNTAFLCSNPYFLQGQGLISLSIKIGETINKVNHTFAFVQPSITSISSAPTLGGVITLNGYDLLPITSNTPRDTYITINGVGCDDLQTIIPFTQMTCSYPAGIQSDFPVVVSIKGQTNNIDITPHFFYRAPSVSSSIAVQSDLDSILTISGSDFWNDTTLIEVIIENGANIINCTVLTASHNNLTCSFPATPFSPGNKNLQVRVLGLASARNNFFAFIDASICPKSCSNAGTCDVGMGLCNCQTSTGAACTETATVAVNTPNTAFPVLSITSPLSADTHFDATIVSIIENNAETIVNGNTTKWIYEAVDPITSTYTWSLGLKKIIVTIRANNITTSSNLAGTTLIHATNSFTYAITYDSGSMPFKTVQFKLALAVSPYECTFPPANLAYPSGSRNNSLRWFEMTKFNVKWFARFPMVANVNNGDGYLNNNIESSDGNGATILVDVQSTDFISKTAFEFDFAALTADVVRQPVVTDCEKATEVPTNGNNSSSDNKWKITVGVVVGVVGAVLISVGSFFLIRSHKKLQDTKSLLDKKLLELNGGL
eukprot:gene1122-1283_t